MFICRRIGFKQATGISEKKHLPSEHVVVFSQNVELPEDDKENKTKDLSDIIGQCGPWQWRTFVVFLLIAFSSSWHNLSITFQAPVISHWCVPKAINGLTNRSLKSQGLVVTKSGCYASITRRSNVSKVYIDRNCQSWEYDTSMYTRTLVSEWDLVCERKWLISAAKSVYMVGHLVAALIFGKLSDKYGRRPITLFTYGLFWVCAMATAFSTSMTMFLILRFLMAIGVTAAYTTAFVTVMEMMGPDVRPAYGVACKFGWTIGYITLPALAWFVRDWRYLQLAITLPWVFMIFMGRFLEESPRWLLTNGFAQRASTILLEASEVNGKQKGDVQMSIQRLCSRALKEKQMSPKRNGIMDLMKFRHLRKSTLCQFFIWFTTSLVYYGLTWSTNDLGGNPYLNFFFSGLVELPATVLSMILVMTYGRKNSLKLSTMATGSVLLLYAGCFVEHDVSLAKLAMFMSAKFGIAVSFRIIYVYSTELFPTAVRGIGIGCCSTMARIGAILSPFVAQIGGHDSSCFCFWTYAFLSLASGIVTTLLPETSNRKLPDTLLDGEEFHRYTG